MLRPPALIGSLLLLLLFPACRGHSRTGGPGSEAEGTRSCADRLAEPGTVQLLEELRRVRAVAEVWPDYHLSQRDLILEWVEGDHACLAHWSRGEIVTVTRAEAPVQTPLGIFGILLTELAQASEAERFGFLAGNVPDPIVRSLKSRGARGALVWVVNTERAAPDFAKDPAQRRSLTHYFLHHESAHVHLLFAPLFGLDDRHPRPRWAVQAQEPALLARCYEAAPARDLFARERATLADAVAATEVDDASAVRRHVAAFTELRRERYAALQGVRVPTQNGAELSCADAEAVWEIDEGGAEFIALTTMRALEVPLPANVSASERIRADRANEPYYYTGAGQLLVLRYLAPAALPGDLRALMTSAEPEGGLYGLLCKRLRASTPEPGRDEASAGCAGATPESDGD